MDLRTAVSLYVAESPGLAPRTHRKLRHLSNLWERHTPNPDVWTIAPETFAAFRKSCESQPLARNTFEPAISDVRTILRHLHDTSRLEALPSAGKRLKRPRNIPRQPTIAEVGRIYAAVHAAKWPRFHSRNPRSPNGRQIPEAAELRTAFWRTFIATALWTALRLRDLIRLERDWMQGDCLAVTANKTGADHEFPVPPFLKRHWETMPHGPNLFRLPSCPEPRIRRELRRICRAADVHELTPREFRRAGITMWTKADKTAGTLVHGCGLPEVLKSYLWPLTILEAAMPRVVVPVEFLSAEERDHQAEQERRLLKSFRRLDTPKRGIALQVCESL